MATSTRRRSFLRDGRNPAVPLGHVPGSAAFGSVRAWILGGVVIELLVVPDCPNEDAALTVLQKAAESAGLKRVPVTVTVIDSSDEAQRRRFLGSPTFLIDGIDPFAMPGAQTGLTCRVYATADGPSGVPDVETLREALVRA